MFLYELLRGTNLVIRGEPAIAAGLFDERDQRIFPACGLVDDCVGDGLLILAVDVSKASDNGWHEDVWTMWIWMEVFKSMKYCAKACAVVPEEVPMNMAAKFGILANSSAKLL